MTAFPKSTTILVTPEARKKYRQMAHKGNPYPLTASEEYNQKFFAPKNKDTTL